MSDTTAEPHDVTAAEGAGVVLRSVGRVGLVSYGVVHVLIAALAVQVALGDRERADKKGALQAVAVRILADLLQDRFDQRPEGVVLVAHEGSP